VDYVLDQLPEWVFTVAYVAVLLLGFMTAPPATPVRVLQISRGLFRFSLRTLMIATTLAAVLLGLVVAFKKP
jgi:hypothetical protein